MPGIIDLQTNLRDLPYSAGDQPYIRTPLPAYNDPNPTDFIGRDSIGRTGLFSAIGTDLERITSWGLDGTGGLIFATKQAALALTGAKTIASRPGRSYNPANTLAQIGVGANQGIHFIKDGGDLDIDDINKYEYVQRNLFSGNGALPNRLTVLKQAKLNKTPSFQAAAVNVNVTNEGVLLKYSGGPGSVGGLGNTKIKRVSFTEEWDATLSTKPLNKQIVALTYNQLDNEVSLTSLSSTGIASIGNFLVTLNDNSSASPAVKTRVLGRLTNYSQFNRDKTFGEGQPGNAPLDFNRQTYNEGAPTVTHGTDLVNFNSIYKSSEAKTGPGYDDMIKFNFGVLDNNDPSQKTYVHLRAYLTTFGDAHSANWDSFKYMGRGENFYRYGGYDRSISVGFRIYVHSRAELFPVYNKINYLASIQAPDYSPSGFQRGNIIYLTIGDYIVNTPGIMEGIEYTFPEDSQWEIARNNDGTPDSNTAELPLLIDASFNFKPIHNFLPRTVTDLSSPQEKFISRLEPSST